MPDRLPLPDKHAALAWRVPVVRSRVAGWDTHVLGVLFYWQTISRKGVRYEQENGDLAADGGGAAGDLADCPRPDGPEYLATWILGGKDGAEY